MGTKIVDYDCLKPTGSYRKHYDKLFADTSAHIEVYRKLSESFSGNLNLSLDELLAGVVCNVLRFYVETINDYLRNSNKL